MKTFFKPLFAVAIIASTVLSSCGKYEEGPKLSLASKKSRLCGDWKLVSAFHNGADITATSTAFYGANFVWSIEKDGKYSQTGNFPDSGTWSLGEDKDDVTFTSATGGIANTYRILRLKTKELWIKQTQTNGDVDEFHLGQ